MWYTGKTIGNRLKLGRDGFHEVKLPLDRVEVAVQLGSKALLQVAHARLDIPNGTINFRDLGFDPTAPGMLIEDRHDFDWSSYRHMILTGLKSLPEGQSVDVGRELDPQFITFDDSVSRSHVRFTLKDNEIGIRDLDSTNGTTVIWTPRQQIRQEQQSSRETLGLRAAGVTHASEHHPNHNDDNYFTDPERGVFGVFDGVGGRPGSDMAAKIAAEELLDYSSVSESVADPDLIRQQLVGVLSRADRSIRSQSGPEIMTTATVMKLFNDKSGDPHCMVASVGDSRAYLWRDNQLAMLTIDHSSGLTGMTDAGKMRQQSRLAEVTSDRELGLDLARAFYNRNAITQVLGGGYNSNDVCIKDLLLQAGDSLILTTDGVHDNLTSSEMTRLIGSVADDPDRTPEALVAAAIARSREGGFRSKPDDMTAVVVRI